LRGHVACISFELILDATGIIDYGALYFSFGGGQRIILRTPAASPSLWFAGRRAGGAVPAPSRRQEQSSVDYSD